MESKFCRGKIINFGKRLCRAASGKASAGLTRSERRGSLLIRDRAEDRRSYVRSTGPGFGPSFPEGSLHRRGQRTIEIARNYEVSVGRARSSRTDVIERDKFVDWLACLRDDNHLSRLDSIE